MNTATGVPVTEVTCWAISTPQPTASAIRSTSAVAVVTVATAPTGGLAGLAVHELAEQILAGLVDEVGGLLVPGRSGGG